jgi:hypothetical protein
MAIPNSSFLNGVLGGPNAGATYEPQRSNNGLLTINGLEDFSPDGGQSIKLAVMNFPLPEVSVSVTEIPYLNERRRYAGNVNYGMMSATFHDYVDRAIARTFWAWHRYIHNPETGLRGVKAKYAKTGYIDIFSPDNDPAAARSYKILNIWPVSINFGSIDMQSDEPVRIGVQFSIDKVFDVNIVTPGAG